MTKKAGGMDEGGNLEIRWHMAAKKFPIRHSRIQWEALAFWGVAAELL